jgi:hypothetical protein
MGRQLYDDPALSIRELYQNALDACRYRDTRLKGLCRTGRNPGEWSGRISFSQGFEDDREYIECEDNGVGMDTDTLKQVFANAGERFVYRESFRSEQAAWQELNPPLQLVSNRRDSSGARTSRPDGRRASAPKTPPRRNVSGWLVKTSAELDRSLGDVLHEAAKLMPDDWTAPDLDLGPLADYTCTSADAKLVSAELEGFPPWIEAPLGPAQVVRAGAALGREIKQVLALCDNLTPLGVRVAGRESYPTAPTPAELDALGQLETLGEPLTPIQLVLIAGRIDGTVHEVHRGLESLEEKGLLVRPDLETLPDACPGQEAVEFLETSLMDSRSARKPGRSHRSSPHLTVAAHVSDGAGHRPV